MKNSSKKTTVKTNLNYSVIMCTLCSLIALTAIIVALTLFHDESILFKIFWLTIAAVLFMLMFFGAILSYQTATLDEKGIIFRCLWFNLAFVKWEEIVKIECQNLDSLYSTLGRVRLNWIVVCTAYGQKPKDGGTNWKKAPWVIKATKKNTSIVKEFAEKFAQNARIEIK